MILIWFIVWWANGFPVIENFPYLTPVWLISFIICLVGSIKLVDTIHIGKE